MSSRDRLFALAGAVVLWIASKLIRAWWSSRVASRRASAALRGEQRAERLLERAGYAILGRQVEREWSIRVDGRPRPVNLRVDLLVSRGRRRYVAEVKTGQLAPRIEHAATRRQLLEYRLAYAVDGVLLVDMEADQIHEIEFSMPSAPRSHAWPLLVGLAIGVLLLWNR